ncbi:MAG TPA: DUF72 domain-containing protein [Pyrinomonadaceae bacterium]|jgi:uncharacterized protein YecE (DUF72 family)|nr:DUF72 domain-containing protein [Pyrinomonadaceae bacterium]
MTLSSEEQSAKTDRRARVEIGCQGWNYEDWVTPPGSPRPVFYPRGTRPAAMLDVYARAFQTVEVDSTFYAVPTASTVEGWKKRTPAGFTLSLKLPQEITHRQALQGRMAARVLSEFCERARLLDEKLAAVLVQLPPQFEATPENRRALREFLPLLPRDIRFGIEFRAPQWFDENTFELLARRPNVSPALVEGPWVARERVWRAAEELTATNGFAYVRWMGGRDITRFHSVVRPQDENLSDWAAVIEQLRGRVGVVYACFSNFYEGHAPASANKLKRLLGQTVVEPGELEDQPSLF